MEKMTQTPAAQKSSLTKALSLAFVCFIASFLGSWFFLGTGLIKPDSTQTITHNREKIVSQEGEVVESLTKKVSPSVVSITTESVTQNPFGLSAQRSEGAGTGIIISKDGYVMTNKHVIGNAESVRIVGNDGTIYKDVDIIGEDPLNDIAFVKIKNVSNLTPAQLGDSADVEVGQKVIAIGNALGEYQNSVTSGIISGQGRPVLAQGADEMGEQLDNLFQTDTAINPGNSGGPLLNLSGEVIGINTAMAEGAENIGFSIPINAAKGLVKSVIDTGKVKKAYLGVKYLSLTPGLAATYSLPTKQGAYIFDEERAAVVEGSPADKAGLKDKDVVTKINNQSIDQGNGMALILSQYTPGENVKLTILRDNKEQTISVTLGEFPER